MQQTVTLPPRAAHLLERLYTSQNVLASLQHLMAGSTCWLLTAVNMHICILVRMLSVPLPAAVTSSLPILRQGPQSLCWLLRFTAGWRTLSWSNFFPRRESAARRLTALPAWAAQRCASAVTQPLLTQESPRSFTSPLHQVATYHAALLVIWFERQKRL